MLPIKNRIKKKKDFELAFKKGKSFKNTSLILKVVKNSLNYSRIGFVVSLKVSKKAVERNKTKRRMSAIMREKFQNIAPGSDLVFILLPQSKEKSFSELKSDVIGIIKKANLSK